MRPNVQDMARLWDMLDGARTAVQFTNDTRFDEFLTDRKTRNAVERNLEIIVKRHAGYLRKPAIPTRTFHGDPSLACVMSWHMSMERFVTKSYGACVEKIYRN